MERKKRLTIAQRDRDRVSKRELQSDTETGSETKSLGWKKEEAPRGQMERGGRSGQPGERHGQVRDKEKEAEAGERYTPEVHTHGDPTSPSTL